MKKALAFIPVLSLILVSVLFMAFAIKAWPGNPIPYQLNDKRTLVGSPFESTNSTSRYALVESMVEYKRFSFDINQAKFSAPDLVMYGNTFFSVFTPGVSFLAVPFYLIGKQLGVAQIATYLSTAILSILNAFLIYKLAKNLGAKTWASWLAGFTFLFGTNALVYAQTLTQHHASTATLLIALLVISKKQWWRSLLFGLLYGLGFLFDFPNLFILFPLGLFLLGQHFQIKEVNKHVQLRFDLSIIITIFGLLPMLFIFGWYNKSLTGSPVRFGQFLGRSNYFDTEEKKARDLKMSQNRDIYEPRLPFNTRIQLQGITVFGISDERSWLFYSPVVLLGILGFYYAFREPSQKGLSVTAFAVIITTLSLYTMFGDPWGGWSFGPRYLLPATALLCVFLAKALSVFRKFLPFLVLFVVLANYSIFISTAGAITTAAIPPKQEALALQEPIPYTYQYNFDYLKQSKVSSGAYNFWLHSVMNGVTFHYFYAGTLIFILFFVTAMLYLRRSDD